MLGVSSKLKLHSECKFACLFRGRGDKLTFYSVNINSGPKIPKGNFGLELIFTRQKVKKLRGGRGQEKVRKIFTFLVLMNRKK